MKPFERIMVVNAIATHIWAAALWISQDSFLLIPAIGCVLLTMYSYKQHMKGDEE